MGKKLLTAAEVAARFGVTVETVARWRREGRIRAVRLGRRTFRFAETELRTVERRGTRNAESAQ